MSRRGNKGMFCFFTPRPFILNVTMRPGFDTSIRPQWPCKTHSLLSRPAFTHIQHTHTHTHHYWTYTRPWKLEESTIIKRTNKPTELHTREPSVTDVLRRLASFLRPVIALFLHHCYPRWTSSTGDIIR